MSELLNRTKTRPAEIPTEELVRVRRELRLIIKRLENTPSHLRNEAEKSDLKALRAYQKSVQLEAGRRFIQLKLL